MKKIKKWRTLSIIQENDGYGWDDIDFADIDDEEEMKEQRNNLKLYRENQKYSSFKVINRKIINDEWFKSKYPQYKTLQNSKEYCEICNLSGYNSGVKTNDRFNELLKMLQYKLLNFAITNGLSSLKGD